MLASLRLQLICRVSHGSQEEFAVRLFRRENQVS